MENSHRALACLQGSSLVLLLVGLQSVCISCVEDSSSNTLCSSSEACPNSDEQAVQRRDVPSLYGPWTSWGGCSNGKQQRTRSCRFGGGCPPPNLISERICGTEATVASVTTAQRTERSQTPIATSAVEIATTSTLYSWSSWGQCGDGWQVRHATCLTTAKKCPPVEKRPCPTTVVTSAVIATTESTSGVTTTTRPVVKTSPAASTQSGRPFEPSPTTAHVRTTINPISSKFGPWSSWTCSNGALIKHRYRNCSQLCLKGPKDWESGDPCPTSSPRVTAPTTAPPLPTALPIETKMPGYGNGVRTSRGPTATHEGPAPKTKPGGGLVPSTTTARTDNYNLRITVAISSALVGSLLLVAVVACWRRLHLEQMEQRRQLMQPEATQPEYHGLPSTRQAASFPAPPPTYHDAFQLDVQQIQTAAAPSLVSNRSATSLSNGGSARNTTSNGSMGTDGGDFASDITSGLSAPPPAFVSVRPAVPGGLPVSHRPPPPLPVPLRPSPNSSTNSVIVEPPGNTVEAREKTHIAYIVSHLKEGVTEDERLDEDETCLDTDTLLGGNS